MTEKTAFATEAAQTADPAVRQEALDALQRDIVIDEAVFLPLTESTFRIAHSGRLRGVAFDHSSGTAEGAYALWIAQD